MSRALIEHTSSHHNIVCAIRVKRTRPVAWRQEILTYPSSDRGERLLPVAPAPAYPERVLEVDANAKDGDSTNWRNLGYS